MVITVVGDFIMFHPLEEYDNHFGSSSSSSPMRPRVECGNDMNSMTETGGSINSS
jgi:hypothetical protein